MSSRHVTLTLDGNRVVAVSQPEELKAAYERIAELTNAIEIVLFSGISIGPEESIVPTVAIDRLHELLQ